jgi:putative RecB family exonuclease
LPIKDGEGIEAQGEALLKVFYETVYQDPPVVIGVEVPFTLGIPDPTTGEILEEALVGALDLVVREEEKHVVGEHKTAAKKWSKDQIKNDGQLSAYKLVARKLGLGEVGLRLQVLTKTKKPKMIVENTDRTDRDEREFLETVVGVLRAIDAQVFYPIRSSMCGGCAFQRRCTST